MVTFSFPSGTNGFAGEAVRRRREGKFTRYKRREFRALSKRPPLRTRQASPSKYSGATCQRSLSTSRLDQVEVVAVWKALEAAEVPRRSGRTPSVSVEMNLIQAY